jgi:glucose/arabinose dehydrogenase
MTMAGWFGIIAVATATLGCKNATTKAAADLALAPTDAGACGTVPSLRLTQVASGLRKPTFVTEKPDDPSALVVLERAGIIRVIQNQTVLASPFADLSAVVSATGLDDGLLGLAFHPDYASNGRVFIDYTDASHSSIVAEYARGAAGLMPVRELLSIANPANIRFGGMLAFGPDGYLYVGTGDGDDPGDPKRNAVNLGSQLGKILRIDVDRFPTPPSGNLTGSNIDPNIWDYGFREPWRFSFDRKTGDLYIGDVGDSKYEEINIEPLGSGQRNYGWSALEGAHCTMPDCDKNGVSLPAAEYSNIQGCAVIGGYVYRGAAIPCLDGWYLYADHCTHNVFALYWSEGRVVANEPVQFVDPPSLGKLSSFGQDVAGELYLVDYDQGTVYRFDSG